MQLDWAIITQAAQVRDGMAFVLGGGFDTIQTEQLPAVLEGNVLIRLLFHRTELDREHAVDVRVLDEDGVELHHTHRHVRPSLPSDLPVGWELPMLVNLPIAHLTLPRAGRYAVEVNANGIHMRSLNLRVKLIGQPPPTGPR